MEPTNKQPELGVALSFEQAKKDSNRRNEIIRLSKRANQKAQETRNHAKVSIDAALECGRLLLEEKAMIEERYKRQRGFWTEYFDTNYGKALPSSTAWRWMKMARLAIDQKTPTENIQRIGVLSLGIMPVKVHPALPGNRGVTRFPSHLSFINRFDVWLRAYLPVHPPATLPDSERQQLKADFRPVIEFVQTFGLIDHAKGLQSPQGGPVGRPVA